MRLYRKLSELESFKALFPQRRSALTIGNFDGLHLGHQALLERVLEAGKAKGFSTLVLTFEPHPVQVLYPERGLKRLFDLKDTFEELGRRGLDGLFAIPFSREFSQLTPQQFFERYIFEALNPGLLVVGHDFSFGADRAGSFDTLNQLCKARGIEIERIQPVIFDGEPVSSSRIRKLLANGDVALAHKLLKRPFYIHGVVEKGFARGRTLGFPTANLALAGETLPTSGVYMTRAHFRGQSHWSVTNVGYNPTFKGKSEFTPVKIESHLLDFNEDIYGLEIKLEFYEAIRAEKKFDSIEQLKQQIEKDIEWGRKWIKQRP